MQTSGQIATPRICLPTIRDVKKKAFRSAQHEAQDVLLDIDEVDLISLKPTRAPRIKFEWLRDALFHDVSRRLIFLNFLLPRVRLTREYDLFIAVCQNFWDLLYFNAIDGWRDHCRTSVCWIDELWAAHVPSYKYVLHALGRFDHIFVGYRGSVATLSRALNRPCHWLPAGVDTFRFSPYPNTPARVIDVYSIGRRCDGIHQALLQAARRREIFYVYDAFRNVADVDTYGHQQHRELFANVAKRARFFMVAPALMDRPGTTFGQVEIGHRYYEGAAAGAVMIGQPPDCEAFRELFEWPDAVITIQPDGSDVMAVLNDLDSDPVRVSAIGRKNATEALLRHDWVYRWKEMFRVAGVEPSPRTTARERGLKDLANFASDITENEASVLE